MDTRKLIDIVKTLTEGDVVDLRQVKQTRALDGYLDAVNDIFNAERSFFETGKFSPFAESYIKSGFDPKMKPEIILQVNIRDYRPGAEQREFMKALRAEGFRFHAPTKWANPADAKNNPNQDARGPWGEKAISIEEARAVFDAREASPYGVYQRSRGGMRTSFVHVWDVRGIGFNIIVGGHDGRRGDKYGNATREEHHIVDDEKDMTEVSHMFALIARARMKAVR